MTPIRPAFLPGITYHVFNRSNNRELLFKEDKHYQYFLKRFRELVAPHVDVLAYCLMPTHFHLLLTVKDAERPDPLTEELSVQAPDVTAVGKDLIRLARAIECEISEVLQTFEMAQSPLHDALTKAKRIQEICLESSTFRSVLPVEKAFKDFFISYTKSINEALGRTGSLFQPKYKRKEVTDDWYFWRLIWYIHNNPVKDGICSSCRDWQWSSFVAIAGDKPTLVRRDRVLGFFGGLEAFLETHRAGLSEDDLAEIKAFVGQESG